MCYNIFVRQRQPAVLMNLNIASREAQDITLKLSQNRNVCPCCLWTTRTFCLITNYGLKGGEYLAYPGKD